MKSLLCCCIAALVACGSGTTSSPLPPPSELPPDLATVYTKIPNPNSSLSISGIRWTQDASRKVTDVSGAPEVTLGSIPGQSWFVFPGPCPVDAQGRQDITAVYPRYQTAVGNGVTVPVTTQPTPYAVGMFVGAQLPVQTCFEFVNCDSDGLGICSFRGFSVGFQ